MSTGTNQGWHLIGADEVRRTWGWFLALGIVLVLLGMMALGWIAFGILDVTRITYLVENTGWHFED
jgi:uncharacterized membrane protein HdeD (DUF308 family)